MTVENAHNIHSAMIVLHSLFHCAHLCTAGSEKSTRLGITFNKISISYLYRSQVDKYDQNNFILQWNKNKNYVSLFSFLLLKFIGVIVNISLLKMFLLPLVHSSVSRQPPCFDFIIYVQKKWVRWVRVLTFIQETRFTFIHCVKRTSEQCVRRGNKLFYCL